MDFEYKVLDDQNLLISSNVPDKIVWGLLATIENYHIEYVKWKPGTSYPEHTHLDPEYMFVISGDLSDHQQTFHSKTLLTYPSGSSHKNLRTDSGVEFILIWTGKQRVRE